MWRQGAYIGSQVSMSDNFFQQNRKAARWGSQAVAVDEGLRAYMLRVYNYMASGVLLSGIVAFLIANSPTAIQVVFGSPLKWVVMLAPLGFVLVLSAGINRLSVFAAQALY